MQKLLVCIVTLLCFSYSQANAQEENQQAVVSNTSALLSLPASLLEHTDKKITDLEDRLQHSTTAYLHRLQKIENKLRKKLAKKDSLAAARVFGDTYNKYQQLEQSLNNPAGTLTQYKQYVPALDSMVTALNFLAQHKNLLQGKYGEAEAVLSNLKGLQDKLQEASAIQQFLKERKQYLYEQLQSYGLLKQWGSYNKEAYYYAAQVQEYKNLLHEPDKLLLRAYSILNQLPAFQSFFKKYSELASLFGVPANYGNAGSLAGLQTRADVQQLIQQRIQAGGPNAQNAIQENMQAAQEQLSKLQDKINKLGGNPDMNMPEKFRANNLRTRTFWQRLEYSTNLQTQQSNYFYPTTTDLGLSIGYKINNHGTIGIGAAYKAGWGNGWNHIRLSQQGAGLRSFIDYRVKGSFFASGGYEFNYQPLNSEVVANNNALPTGWTQSGLLGLTKIVSLKSKLFKKTKLQLLWDFLSYSQVPRTQAIKFRVGYNF